LQSTARNSCVIRSIGDITLRASVLSGDGPSTRYSQLRMAVENGLAPASVLKVRRKKKPNEVFNR
jgi:hypothetical protein